MSDERSRETYEVNIKDETYEISRDDVKDAFEDTEEPYDSISARIYIDGKGKGLKDVFRSIEHVPDDTGLKTGPMETAFNNLGFRTGRVNHTKADEKNSMQAWHIGTGRNGNWWPVFLDKEIVSIGHHERCFDIQKLGLSTKGEINKHADTYGSNLPSDWGKQLEKFAVRMSEGDVIFAKVGKGDAAKIQGIAIVGKYSYDESLYTEEFLDDYVIEKDKDNYHHREIEWVMDLRDTPDGAFHPDGGNIERWTVDEVEYRDLKQQMLEERDYMEEHFQTLEKKAASIKSSTPNFWIEKSHHDRQDRDEDGWGVGDALWAPQTKSNGHDSTHYNKLKKIEKDDVILILDQSTREIKGVARAEDTYEETYCLEGTKWDREGVESDDLQEVTESGERPAYKVTLKEYRELDSPLDVSSFLRNENKELLDDIRGRGDVNVVYREDLQLNQGAYLTDAPRPFVELIDRTYRDKTGEGLPHVSGIDVRKDNQKETDDESSDYLRMSEWKDEMLEEERPELYRQAIAHLTAGRNVVFYGPPGTGKTRAAKLVAGWLCSDFDIETANAEWSNYTVVGGWKPDDSGSGGFEPGRGFLTEAAETCRIEIDNGNQPHWLVVDELNRANLDEAFGDIFTVLDIDYRSEYPVSYAGEDQQIPLSFRILATMNSYDRAQLFSLGYAFRRRFAFVAVDSLFRGSDSISYSGWGSTSEGSEPGTKPENMEEIIEIAREETVSHFQRTGKNNDGSIKLPDKDAAAIEIDLASENIRDTIDTVLGDDSLRTSGLNPLEAVMHLIGETHEAGVVDVGQAAVIDILKYLTAYRLLFADSMGPHVVDQAVVSYLVPQYDAVMPDLRRANTIGQESGAVQDYRRIVDTADELGLRMTEKKLNNPIENDEYSLI